jgi:Fe-S-cluster containining protein
MIPLNVVTEHSSKCHNCGGCCELIPLNLSPEELERQIEINPLSDNARVARMLRGRYLGMSVMNDERHNSHLYGPCPNLVYFDGDGGAKVGVCAIHDCRPHMCSGFPDYGRPVGPNVAYIQGCGYNRDAMHGFDIDDARAVAEGRLAPSLIRFYFSHSAYERPDDCEEEALLV